uniref:TIAM Rac1 associated GEF 1a n=1 Tax=Astatotilapia calliptera TaxID=8154 RepID=A0A3P8NDU0_ASTCA
MGNVESQNGESSIHGDVPRHLSRKHTTRSLRVSNKQQINRRSRHSSSVKQNHRNSEASTRSSSTPSIPQSLVENGLEFFNAADEFDKFGINPHWTQRVAMTMRPESYQHDDDPLATPTPETSEADTIAQDGGEDSTGEGDTIAEERFLQQMTEGPREGASNKKKRSKSADMWREDSLEFSMSDLSQEHLTSTEEMVDGGEEEEGHTAIGGRSTERASSLDHLCSQQSPGFRGQRSRYIKNCREAECDGDGEVEEGLMSPAEDDGGGYGAFTLPCRRSHCLSEGLTGLGIPATPCPTFQGRRAQTTQDISGVLGEGSEYGDSGIDGVAPEIDGEGELLSRRCKAMSASFSVYSATESSFFNGSDSGSSSAGGVDGRGGEGDCTEEAGSAVSDEQSSGTLSSMYPPDTLISCAHGTVRKAGTLAVKNFLVHKKNKKVEPAARRKWKQYWVSLKGCTLFLYEYDGRSGIDHNSVHKHALWVENSIVQAVPEHPKKDFVFCLSNSVGDAFLFQTSGQTELENWITAIHSACATALARQHHREDTVRLLRTEIRKLEQKIDMDEKMKKMGDMQLSTVTDGKKRKTILEQIFLWEQNLERFHIDLFRCRCYLASLQGGEPPNPKRLLGFASRPTKVAMGRLGIFSVSSFHALVSARTESSMRRRNQPFPRTFSKRRSRFSSLWGLDTASRRKSKGHPSIDQVRLTLSDFAVKSLQKVFEDSSSEKSVTSVKSLPQQNVDSDIWVPEYLKPSWVCLPNNQPILAVIQPGETTLEVLNTVCKTHKIDPSGHYLRLKVLVDNQILYYVPTFEEDISDLVRKYTLSHIRYIFLSNNQVNILGLNIHISLKAGDEILLLNGKEASALQKDDMMSAFTNQTLTLSISTLPQLDPRMVCSCPPRRSDVEQNLATDIFSQSQGKVSCLKRFGDHGPLKILHALLPFLSEQSTEQVTVFCRGLHDINPPECPMSSPVSVLPPTAAAATQKQLSHADKLRKVINELVETEKTYVKDLNCLIERYLKPLQEKSFLTQDELDVLFGNLGEMVEFQVEFLRTLEDGIRLMPDQERLERVEQFKKVLFSLGGSFLYYADRFKIYSAFCASHTKVPKVLAKAKTDPEFKAFLAEKNPRQQHSSTLESYLIKPIQRVLKYPLLLRELYSLTDPDSEEHYHLDVAIKAMNKVASHINEMQKLHEEYGAVFDQLINEQTADKKEVADLSMGDLLLHSTVAWINPQTSLAKSKKDPDLAAFVFKTAVVFVYKDCSKHRKKIGASHRGSGGDEKDPIRFRHMIATDSLQVRTLPNSEATADCEIVHTRSESEGRPERSFQLCFSSPESKKDFLKAVHSILREKQRRQLLKTECLPPSQQYVPFGGKRLSALKGVRPTMNRAASAPSRTLARRRLVRNRITIDTDLPCKPQGEDTDRWVEEQFNLGCYENQCEGTDVGQVKETDILSDDDEYCTSVRAMSTKLDNLEEQMKGLNLQGKDISLNGGVASLKQCAVEGATNQDHDVIWVRRDDFANSDRGGKSNKEVQVNI